MKSIVIPDIYCNTTIKLKNPQTCFPSLISSIYKPIKNPSASKLSTVLVLIGIAHDISCSDGNPKIGALRHTLVPTHRPSPLSVTGTDCRQDGHTCSLSNYPTQLVQVERFYAVSSVENAIADGRPTTVLWASTSLTAQSIVTNER